MLGASPIAAPTVLSQEARPMLKVTKAVVPPEEDSEIVYEIPTGETTVYSRECTAFHNDYFNGVTISHPKGSMTKKTYVAEDGTLWFSNPLSEFMLLSYVKGRYDENGSIVIEGPQLVYSEYDYDLEDFVNAYLLPMVMVTDEAGATYVSAEDMKYVLKKTENGYEAENPDLLLGLATYGELADLDGNPTGEMGYAWLGYGDRGMQLTEAPADNGINPPASVQIEKWTFTDPYEKGLINVAIDGDAIYIQGLDRGVPEAWAKATVKDGKATIPSGQYLGYNESIGYLSYIWGSKITYYEESEGLLGDATDEAVFIYDAEKKEMTLKDGYGYAICSTPDEYYLITLYAEVSLKYQNRNVNTPPSAPTDLGVTGYDDYYEFGIIEFDMSVTDEEGNILDKNNLYYTIYINGEPFEFTPETYPVEEATTLMPYSLYDNCMIYRSDGYHTIYFDAVLPEDACGVQAVYINEEGKEIRSKIVTSGTSGAEMNVTGKNEVSRSVYNMQGQSVSDGYRGPVIVRTAYDDGSVKVSKSMRTK